MGSGIIFSCANRLERVFFGQIEQVSGLEILFGKLEDLFGPAPICLYMVHDIIYHQWLSLHSKGPNLNRNVDILSHPDSWSIQGNRAYLDFWIAGI